MRILFCIVFLLSTQVFAEEDLMAQFERIQCHTNPKTKEQSCTLDGKKIPSSLDKKKQSAKTVEDDELDIITE